MLDIDEKIQQLEDRRKSIALIKALGDESGNVRKEAIGGLEQIGEAAVPELIEALKSQNKRVWDGSVEVLSRLEKSARSTLREQIHGALQNAFKKKSIKQKRSEVRDASMGVGTPDISLLTKALKDKNFDVRVNAAVAIGKFGINAIDFDEFIHELLSRTMNNKTKKRASEALVRIGIPASPVLLEALSSPTRCIHAAEALMMILKSLTSYGEVGGFEFHIIESHGADFQKTRNADSASASRAEYAISILMKLAADRKNELASRRDILLEEMPTPQKKDRIYRTVARNKNG